MKPRPKPEDMRPPLTLLFWSLQIRSGETWGVRRLDFSVLGLCFSTGRTCLRQRGIGFDSFPEWLCGTWFHSGHATKLPVGDQAPWCFKRLESKRTRKTQFAPLLFVDERQTWPLSVQPRPAGMGKRCPKLSGSHTQFVRTKGEIRQLLKEYMKVDQPDELRVGNPAIPVGHSLFTDSLRILWLGQNKTAWGRSPDRHALPQLLVLYVRRFCDSWDSWDNWSFTEPISKQSFAESTASTMLILWLQSLFWRQVEMVYQEYQALLTCQKRSPLVCTRELSTYSRR